MESLFQKDPLERPKPSVYDLIEKEISHLKKGGSVRDKPGAKGRSAPWAISIAICAVLGLYFMDPFFYAKYKSDAIHTYLYLHNYDSGASLKALATSGIFSGSEMAAMDREDGSFGSYYGSADEAEKKSDAIVHYMNGLQNLHNGKYEQLDPVGKVRYLLFVRPGLMPPSEWRGLNPSVQ